MWRSQRGKIRVKDFIKCTIYLVIIGILFFFAGRIVPKKWFRYDRFPYRMLGFEKDGKIYQAIGIRKWKSTFPDMSVLLPKWMPSKKITGHGKCSAHGVDGAGNLHCGMCSCSAGDIGVWLRFYLESGGRLGHGAFIRPRQSPIHFDSAV